MAKREMLTVEVRQRTLWIGGDAYPLSNISRVQTSRWKPRVGALIWAFVKAAIGWSVLGLAAAVIAAVATSRESGSAAMPLVGLVAVIVLALIAFEAFRFVRRLSALRFFELVIETAGSTRTPLMSKDEGVVVRLVTLIVTAIDNPQAEFQMQVENFHVGDNITQHGNHNTGKRVHP